MFKAMSRIDPGTDTFFQQKWKAKAMTRAYHGDHVSEHRWERLFSRRLMSVVSMDPEYMAQTDGSTEGAGRGSGLQMKTAMQLGAERRAQLDEGIDMLTGTGKSPRSFTPYMNMTFAPLERRLDTAIYRAMFATSARQARNFVIHGHVKVNGMKVDKPTYMLNPGDMFQVNPEMVKFATGIHKGQPGIEPPQDATTQANVAEDGPSPADLLADVQLESTTSTGKEEIVEDQGAETDLSPKEEAKRLRVNLQKLMAEAKQVLEIDKQQLNATTKRRIRDWRQKARQLLSKTGRQLKKEVDDTTTTATAASSASDTEVLNQLNDFVKGLTLEDIKAGTGNVIKERENGEGATATSTQEKISEEAAASAAHIPDITTIDVAGESSGRLRALSDAELVKLGTVLEDEAAAVTDARRRTPYAYPWRPRPYMAAFAYIPRYLEVNPNICAAVYLRHPVARPGRAEVPTPFPEWINALAFNYYLRRG